MEVLPVVAGALFLVLGLSAILRRGQIYAWQQTRGITRAPVPMY